MLGNSSARGSLEKDLMPLIIDLEVELPGFGIFLDIRSQLIVCRPRKPGREAT